MTWLSPSFPVGAYAFSHGLETAVENGLITDAASAGSWIDDLVRFGNGRSDLVFLAEAYEASCDLDEFSGSLECEGVFRDRAELSA